MPFSQEESLFPQLSEEQLRRTAASLNSGIDKELLNKNLKSQRAKEKEKEKSFIRLNISTLKNEIIENENEINFYEEKIRGCTDNSKVERYTKMIFAAEKNTYKNEKQIEELEKDLSFI